MDMLQATANFCRAPFEFCGQNFGPLATPLQGVGKFCFSEGTLNEANTVQIIGTPNSKHFLHMLLLTFVLTKIFLHNRLNVRQSQSRIFWLEP
jgi:hypothetical protein